MAEDVICLLDYLGWTGDRELTIVGISLGGMIAQGVQRLFCVGFTKLLFRARISHPKPHLCPRARRHYTWWTHLGQLPACKFQSRATQNLISMPSALHSSLVCAR